MKVWIAGRRGFNSGLSHSSNFLHFILNVSNDRFIQSSLILPLRYQNLFDKMFIPTLLWLLLLIEKVVVLDVKIVLKFKLTQSLEGVWLLMACRVVRPVCNSLFLEVLIFPSYREDFKLLLFTFIGPDMVFVCHRIPTWNMSCET